ncbi:MAG: type I methionyl aminopeptidase [Planctomycetota bacterium]
MIERKTLDELEIMREAGRIVAGALAVVKEVVRAGVTTHEIDVAVERFITSHGAWPSFKGYHGFPASICASINEEVVHGIPGPRRLREGDIVSVDVGVFYRNFHGDAAATFPVGAVDAGSRRLIDTCRQGLERAIEAVRPGARLWEVSVAVQRTAEEAGFSVVEQYVGHGIGRQLHEDPQVPNYVVPTFKSGPGRLVLQPGIVLAIEPMFNAGVKEVYTRADRWTIVTADGKRSAHFEHTVAVTADGPRVLTLP